MNTHQHGQPNTNHHHNERSNLAPRSYHGEPRPYTPGPPEDVLDQTTLNIERKTFVIKRCQNVRGSFMRVIEEGNSPKKNAIIIPLDGLADFIKAVQSVGGI